MHTTIKFLSKRGISVSAIRGSDVTGKPSTSAWRTPIAAAALAMVLGLPALDAHALALGRVTVLSALGEPLRAEIDVPDINVDEAASLKTSVANPEAFKAAGLEYNPALGSLQITLLRRPDGRAYLRLAGDRPINEPFVDLILEANWAAGKIVRDYTMLFDPANLRTATAPAAAVTASAVPSAIAAPSPLPGTPSAPSAGVPRVAAARAPAPVAPKIASPAAKIEKPATAASDGTKVTVKPGNTATQIAVRYKPVGVSLDQMLVAMLQANPDAFISNNLNRLKSGAVLDVPSAAQASAVSEGEARQVITAQSKDFNEFRRRLAAGAPTATAPSASRAASGTVQAKVEDRKPAAVAPDKLTLSKGAVAAAGSASAAKTNKEDAIAQEKQAKDAAARTAELAKNIQDLSKLGTTTTATAKPEAAKPAASASKPGIAVATGAPANASSAPVTAAPSATPASAAVATASAVKPAVSVPLATASADPGLTASTSAGTTTATVVPNATATTDIVAAQAAASAAKPSAPVAKAPIPPMQEPSLVDDLLDNPFTLPAAGVLLALLAGFGFYRLRQRKSTTQVDSSFLESRLQPDSFFGASGGQRIDTSDAAASGNGSSMVYSPSQLDAAGDVDPVAEADVYLAYGRDLQAEEILKEAMRTNPSRVAIHTKLMEIYAKRRDTKAFEIVAHEAFSISKGQGPDWDAASAMGRELDPANPLYQPGGAPSQAAGGAMAAGAAAMAFAAHTQPQSEPPSLSPADNSDFDLDFSLDDEQVAAAKPVQNYTATSPIHVEPTVSMQAPTPSAMSPLVDLNFDIPPMPGMASAKGHDPMKLSVPDMASFASGLSFTPEPFAAASAPTEPAKMATTTAPTAMESLEFDMGSLSLDLPGSTSGNATTGMDASDEPLETKLALAQEFREIGDNDGARALAQEVAMEATGTLKARAQHMVTDLS